MYDELVKQLRDNAEFLVKASSGYLSNSFADTMGQAADAIEEMQKCLDGVEADNDSLCATIEELERGLKRSKEYEAFWEKEANEALKKFQMAIAWYIIQEIKDDADYDNMQRLVSLVHVYEKCKEEVDNAKDQPAT